jgi:hypothetical protein
MGKWQQLLMGNDEVIELEAGKKQAQRKSLAR